ncbi:MAG: 5'/3'-nucleotidase SurE [Chloroflexi bacterium]|nr:5'/3'-nucleotidase SurE [Chloroflexota bacterium]
MPPNAYPLILVTNDDGISSPGLVAAAEAMLPLAEVFVVAPDRQWSGAGRSMPDGPQGRVLPYDMWINEQPVAAYQVDGSPALVVLHALLELVPRQPDLVVSGINFGANVGNDITVSGTVGAALQAAACGIPALAVSLETPKDLHRQLSDEIDFGTAAHFARALARWRLACALPHDVDILKLDVPDDATPATPCRVTRASRHTYYTPSAPPPREMGDAGLVGYDALAMPWETESNSDIYALAVERTVSITPLSLDLTSRVDLGELESLMWRDCRDLLT